MTTSTAERTITDTVATTQQGADQIRQVTERTTDAGRTMGRLVLDTYEQAMDTLSSSRSGPPTLFRSTG